MIEISYPVRVASRPQIGIKIPITINNTTQCHADIHIHSSPKKMASVATSCRAAYCFNTISSATASNSLFPRSSTSFCSQFSGSPLVKLVQVERKRFTKTSGKIYAMATVTDDIKEYTLSSWAEFEIGQSSVYWRTENGLPPMAGEKLTVYYNPASSKLAPNPEYGIAFNGGFNQPIMCGGEPRAMSRRDRGKVSDPFYMIKILVPKHALTLIFSFTDGTNWDGPYKLQFEVPAKWRNKPISFFNEGLTAELSQDGACEKAIYAETNFVVQRCAFPANLVVEGGDRCKLDLVPGCTDPESFYFNPLANVDDGSCELVLENE